EHTLLFWVPASSSATTCAASPPTGTTASTTLVSATAREFVLQNFQRVAETYWSVPGVFCLKLLLLGRNDNDFSKATRALLREDDHLTANFGTQFQINGREMFKSNPIAFNNFSTMTEDTTYQHEVGHA